MYLKMATYIFIYHVNLCTYVFIFTLIVFDSCKRELPISKNNRYKSTPYLEGGLKIIKGCVPCRH